jgi:hypothetical protein
MARGRFILNRKQIILTCVGLTAVLFVAIDYKSDTICKLIGLRETNKWPRETSWYYKEWLVLAVSYAGLLYVLRTKSSPKKPVS